MTSGVEIENTGIVAHHHTMKEIQQLSVTPLKVFERTVLKIENPDDGDFIWTFKNPKTDEYSPSDKMSVNATASKLRDGIKGYYKAVKGDIYVVRYQMDEDGNNCTVSNKPVKTNIYEITMRKLITDVSCKNSIISKFGSSATITAYLPGEDVRYPLSSPPLSGKFKVKCLNSAGQLSISSEISYNYSPYWVAMRISESCFGLYNKIEGLKCPQDDGYSTYY